MGSISTPDSRGVLCSVHTILRSPSPVLRHRVGPSRMPGVASREPPKCHPPASSEPMPIDGLQCVVRAGWCESTRRGEQRRDEHLVAPNHRSHHDSEGISHCRIPKDASARDRAASSTSGAALAVSGRATSARSHPGQDAPDRLTLSRSTRFDLLRLTAPPRRVPATKITRPPLLRSGGVGSANTRSAGFDTRRPPANSRSISVCAVMVCIAAPKGGRTSLGCAWAENLAALATTGGKDCPAGPCGHPLAEAVGLGPLPIVRLVRTLHFSPPYPYPALVRAQAWRL